MNIRLNFSKSTLSPEKTLCINLNGRDNCLSVENDNVIYATAVDDDSVDEGIIIIDDVNYNIHDVVIGDISNSTNERDDIIAERYQCFKSFAIASYVYFSKFSDAKTCNITGFYIYKNDRESILKILEHIIADKKTNVIIVCNNISDYSRGWISVKAITNKMNEHRCYQMHPYKMPLQIAFCKY